MNRAMAAPYNVAFRRTILIATVLLAVVGLNPRALGQG